MHASYYYRADCVIMVFDVTRKITYKTLDKWWADLQAHRPGVPVIVVANKIDADPSVTSKTFAFATKHEVPFFFVSAADGTNVVRVCSAVVADLLGTMCPEHRSSRYPRCPIIFHVQMLS
jgi:Rab-like protein 2